MKKNHYNITVRREGVMFFSLENLNQAYGLLAGCFPSFQDTFLSVKHFKLWWRQRTDKKKTYSIVDANKIAEFTIETRY
jgi:hypothetical protein